MKSVKLAATAVVTFGLCLSFWYIQRFPFSLNRCLRAARPWYACFVSRSFNFTSDFYGMAYEGNISNSVDQIVLEYGAYEKPVLYFFRDVMLSLYPGTGVFVDVGAHVGQHTMFMSRYAKEVHAFEPYPPVLQRLERHIEINKLTNVIVHPVGLGAKEESLPFFKPPEANEAIGSFVPKIYDVNTPYTDLKIMRGDTALQSTTGRVALIKIDVEGYERFVLSGLTATLARYRPIVFLELTSAHNPHAIKNKPELQSLFPEDYALAAFPMSRDTFKTGAYELVSFDKQVDFSSVIPQNIVAYPAELEGKLPRNCCPSVPHERENEEAPHPDLGR